MPRRSSFSPGWMLLLATLLAPPTAQALDSLTASCTSAPSTPVVLTLVAYTPQGTFETIRTLEGRPVTLSERGKPSRLVLVAARSAGLADRVEVDLFDMPLGATLPPARPDEVFWLEVGSTARVRRVEGLRYLHLAEIASSSTTSPTTTCLQTSSELLFGPFEQSSDDCCVSCSGQTTCSSCSVSGPCGSCTTPACGG